MKPKPGRARPSARAKGSAVTPASTSVEVVRVESLAADGRGLVRLVDGRVAFVAGTCPGDEVEASIEARPNRLDARALRVIAPSPSRVDPPCAIVRSCGGCDWMHVAIKLRESAHAEIVRAALAHAVTQAAAAARGAAVDPSGETNEPSAAKARAEVPAPEIVSAPKELGYRTRARLHVKVDRAVHLGYLAPRSHEIVDVRSCSVLDPRLEGALAIVRELLGGARGAGEVQLALGQAGRAVVDVMFRGEVPPGSFALLDRLTTGDAPALAGARLTLDGAQRPASFGDPRPVQTGADGMPVVLAPGGFGQPSDEGAAMLAARVAQRAEAAGKHVVELFSGSGTLSLLLARDALSYVGVEIDEAASRAARQNLEARGLAHKLVVADADAFEIPKRADVVVLDPPRTGARGAARAIAAAKTKRVVYVSCDAATLARDVGTLAAAGYEIASVDALELFPQTSHVETVVVLVQRRGR